MRVLNLYGGPGTGKSTTASGLFALMKLEGYNVELVHEYAKAVTWERRDTILQDQLYILAKQNRMLERLRDQVDYVITDSPLLFSLIYGKDFYPDSFHELVTDIYSSYDNVDIFLTRQKKYVQVGRYQTEDEAREKDQEIRDMLIDLMGPDFITVDADQTAPNVIIDLIKYSL